MKPLDAAIRYAANGWHVFPCRGKQPLVDHGCKDATVDENQIRSWWRKWPDANVAIATGALSGLYVIDQDDGGDETIEGLALPLTLAVVTGSGGRHFYFKRPDGERWPNTARKLGPGVDTRGDGGYVMAPPSIHPETHQPYAWDKTSTAVVELPENVRTRLQPRAAPRPAENAQREVPTAYAERALTDECEQVAHAAEGTRNHRLNAAAFSLGQLVAAGQLDATRVRAELGAAARSAGLEDREIEQTLDSGLRAGSEFPREVKDRPRASRGNGVAAAGEAPKKAPRPTPALITKVLSDHDQVRTALAFDVQQNAPVLVKAPPWFAMGPFPRRLSDVDITRAQVWLETDFGLVCSDKAVHAALIDLAERTKFNPIAAWLEGLRWDGTERLSTWLQDLFGVEDDGRGYVSAVGRAWLISAVARALTPGCKADHVLVLEGQQGVGKSSGLRSLVGDAWFADHMPDFGTREAAMVIGRAWVHELAELATLRRSEVEKIKQFLAQQEDEYRPPWGRSTIVIPRRCIFVATTNMDTYLRDPSGSRRFWPVRVRVVDLPRIKLEREQLWAEAVAAFNKGEHWHLSSEVEAIAREEQDERSEVDPWEPLLADWAADKPFVTQDEAFKHLGIDAQKRDATSAQRIGRIFLSRLKWLKGRAPGDESGKRAWRYVRPKDPCPPLSMDKRHSHVRLALSLSQNIKESGGQVGQGGQRASDSGAALSEVCPPFTSDVGHGPDDVIDDLFGPKR